MKYNLKFEMANPTIEEIRRGSRQNYNTHWIDSNQTLVNNLRVISERARLPDFDRCRRAIS